MVECDGIIYCYTNKVDGKKYIGQTTKKVAYSRHNNHRRMDCRCVTYFYKAIAKYGYDSFDLVNLEENISRDLLDEREIFWIKELDTKIPNGYNMTEGGGGRRGYPLSEKQKEALRIGNQRPDLVELRKKRMRDLGEKKKGPNNHNYGKGMHPNAAKALKEANQRPEVIAASIERIRMVSKSGPENHNYDKPCSDSQKEAISRANSGRYIGAKSVRAKAIICVEVGKIFLAITEVKTWLGVPYIGNVCTACKTGKKCGGYHWRYATEEEVQNEKLNRSLADKE
jgi:group I intron endonuclease